MAVYMLHLDDLFIFSSIPLFLAFFSGYFGLKQKSVFLRLASGFFFLCFVYVFVSLLVVQDDEKINLDDNTAKYYFSCGGYYSLQYLPAKGRGDSAVVGSAPGTIDEFCDGRLLRLKGKMGRLYENPICSPPINKDSCKWIFLPVVHLTEIESLTNPPTYPEGK